MTNHGNLFLTRIFQIEKLLEQKHVDTIDSIYWGSEKMYFMRQPSTYASTHYISDSPKISFAGSSSIETGFSTLQEKLAISSTDKL